MRLLEAYGIYCVVFALCVAAHFSAWCLRDAVDRRIMRRRRVKRVKAFDRARAEMTELMVGHLTEHSDISTFCAHELRTEVDAEGHAICLSCGAVIDGAMAAELFKRAWHDMVRRETDLW